MWNRCTKSRPCRICDKPDWCSWTDDGAHRCMRVSAADGFRVVKECEDGGVIFRREGDRGGDRRDYRRAPAPPKPKPRPDFSKIWARCYAACDRDMAQGLADELGLKKGETLSLMGLGWHPENECWVFPMYGSDMEQIRGLRTRDKEGNKKALLGSQQGLFGFPTALDFEQVLICEGPTDTAAAIELGLSAIGRPSCNGASEMVRTACTGKHAVIVSDSDEPGRRGADKLATQLRRFAASVKIVRPPSKDMREWYRSGATRASMDFLISNTRPIRA